VETQTVIASLTILVSRILLAALFILAALGKISGYSATAAFMTSMGVPGALLPLVIVGELAGGVLILVGWQTRLVAVGLAAFTLVAGAIFHGNIADQNHLQHLLKNIAIVGGFLALAAHGAGALSVDAWRARSARA